MEDTIILIKLEFNPKNRLLVDITIQYKRKENNSSIIKVDKKSKNR